jgi:predicted transcriptional regulator
MPMPVRPTDAELGILRVLWEREPCAVRDVHEALVAEGKPVGYTTVLKFLQIMTEKKLVRRDTRGRAHLYRSAIPRPRTQKQLVDDLVERAFGGAASELVLHALTGRKASPEDLAEIRRLLDRLERGPAGT